MNQKSRIRWYIEHRIEYLEIRQKALKVRLEPDEQFDYTALKEFMLNKGALYELRNLLNRLDRL